MTRKRARRGRGEGSIYYDEERKLWVSRMSLGYDGRGKRIRPTVYGKTKREVQEKLDALRDEVRSGTYVEPTRLTVRDHFEDWLRTKKGTLSSGTYLLYKSHVDNHILPALGKTQLRSLSRPEQNSPKSPEQTSPFSPI